MIYQVIIIEDDPMVASINRQYVESTPGFAVVGIFKNGAEALEFLRDSAATVDLIVLDYYMPLMGGFEFVEQVHNTGTTASIIMVTSANEACIIQSLLARGVLDYLVKPFEYKRFKQAIDKFLRTKQYFESGRRNLDQEAIDMLTLFPQNAGDKPAQLAKGMNAATLDLIRAFLSENKGDSFTSEQIADQVHLSRITIRRYVNYLLEIGEVASTIDYQTGGRPSIRYCFTGTI